MLYRNVICSVRNTVSDHVRKGITVKICAIALSKAFDKVNQSALYTKMMKRFTLQHRTLIKNK